MRIKFCGLRSAEDVAAADDAGAHYVGLVFFPRSPRHLEFDAAETVSAAAARAGLTRVALTVNADDALLESIIARAPVEMLQLHGAETPERVADVRARFGLPVMKAVGLAEESDLAAIDLYDEVADQILIDARPSKNATRPGGNGLTFDWRLIEGRSWRCPWMLSGGLTPQNAAEAVRRTGAQQLDVSSGIERTRGVKDAALMRAFAQAVG